MSGIHRYGRVAALPGVIASMTSKPVIGVPVGGKVPMDSLLSIVQMPPGMPVATVGVDRGDNAGSLQCKFSQPLMIPYPAHIGSTEKQ